MKPLRILHSEAATGFGGQENRIFKEMCAMRTAGHHMEALCQPHAHLAQRLVEEGFRVHTMPMDGPRHYFRGVFRARRILKEGRFDVLNTHSRRDTMLAGVAARLAGTPLIVRTRHLAVRPGSLVSYTGVPHRVTTVSEHVRQLLLDCGAVPERVATVYSPIPLPDPVEHSTLRAELGLPADAIVVGCVSVMREKKGHRALIDAMAGPLRRPDVFLVLVGDGSPTLENLPAHGAAALGVVDQRRQRRREGGRVMQGHEQAGLAVAQHLGHPAHVRADHRQARGGGLDEDRAGGFLFGRQGEQVEAGKVIARMIGFADVLISAERVALNLLQRLSGIATLTNRYVKAVEGTGARIGDTRASTPGLRLLERFAVELGGGYTTRFGLDDGVLVTLNHISIIGSVSGAVKAAKENLGYLHKIAVEVSSENEIKDAIEGGADIVVIEGSSGTEFARLAAIAKEASPAIAIECAGQITPENVREYAAAGAQLIRVQALTSSAPAMNISFRVQPF